jgi:hypothetical protein
LRAKYQKTWTYLFGSASTVCPDGQRGVTFWLYIEYYGKGGWYSEVPEVKDGEITVPQKSFTCSPNNFMNEALPTVPQENGVPIREASE